MVTITQCEKTQIHRRSCPHLPKMSELTNDPADHVELPGAGESIAWKSQTPCVIRKRVMRLCVVSLTSLRWCFTTSRRDRPGSSTALGPFSDLVSRGRRRTICQLIQRFKIAQYDTLCRVALHKQCETNLKRNSTSELAQVIGNQITFTPEIRGRILEIQRRRLSKGREFRVLPGSPRIAR